MVDRARSRHLTHSPCRVRECPRRGRDLGPLDADGGSLGDWPCGFRYVRSPLIIWVFISGVYLRHGGCWGGGGAVNHGVLGRAQVLQFQLAALFPSKLESSPLSLAEFIGEARRLPTALFSTRFSFSLACSLSFFFLDLRPLCIL